MDSIALFLLPALIVLSLLVSISDWRHRRIPNLYLIVGLLYVALVHALNAATLGGSFLLRATGFSLMGILLATLILSPAYFLKQLGAGDVKFGMVIGAFLGPVGAVLSIILGAIIGGLWALALSWRHGGLGQLWNNLKHMARSAYLSGFREMNWDLRSAGAVTMPYGIALSVGAIAVALWQLSLR